jgi:hypothetical protein
MYTVQCIRSSLYGDTAVNNRKVRDVSFFGFQSSDLMIIESNKLCFSLHCANLHVPINELKYSVIFTFYMTKLHVEDECNKHSNRF